MDFRTDLALERREILGEKIDGVVVNKIKGEQTNTTIIDVKTHEAAARLDKAKGKYITVEMEDFSFLPALYGENLKVLTESIGSLLPKVNGTILVAGIGNNELTSDSLGPGVASKIFATRHISKKMQKEIGFDKELASVSVLETSVLGKTGIETGEYIKSICDVIKPKCVITVDALASKSIKRLGKTVQMSNTGIAPGSGVGNKRVRIDENLLGVPVIAVGVPTVVSALNLSSELSGEKIESFTNENIEIGSDLIVAPKDIDLIIKNSSLLLALAINCSIQKNLSFEEIYSLM